MGKVSLPDCTHLAANGCRCQAWREQGPGLVERFTVLQFHRRQLLSEASTMPHRVEDGRRCRHAVGFTTDALSDVDSQQQAPACADADLQVTRDIPRSRCFFFHVVPAAQFILPGTSTTLSFLTVWTCVVLLCRASVETHSGGTAGRSRHCIARFRHPDLDFPGPFPAVWSTSIRDVQDSHSTLRLDSAAGVSPGG